MLSLSIAPTGTSNLLAHKGLSLIAARAGFSVHNGIHFHLLHIVKTGRTTLFLAAGFVRVGIKELVLSGVPDRTPPVK